MPLETALPRWNNLHEWMWNNGLFERHNKRALWPISMVEAKQRLIPQTQPLRTSVIRPLKPRWSTFLKGYYIINTTSFLLPENVDKLMFLEHNMKNVEGKLKACNIMIYLVYLIGNYLFIKTHNCATYLAKFYYSLQQAELPVPLYCMAAEFPNPLTWSRKLLLDLKLFALRSRVRGYWRKQNFGLKSFNHLNLKLWNKYSFLMFLWPETCGTHPTTWTFQKFSNSVKCKTFHCRMRKEPWLSFWAIYCKPQH